MKFTSFTVISAFASESGVLCLAECIERSLGNFESIKIIVGIDQEGTSVQALEKILELKVISYIFYQKEAPIFHPKIYLFEGKDDYTLIVGSSNLTGKGLFSNVESSIRIDGKIGTIDSDILNQLKGYYSSLFDLTDQNLFEITAGNIKAFIEKGIVPTQIIWKRKYGKHISEMIENQIISLEIPIRKVAKIPNAYKGRYKTDKVIKEIVDELEVNNYNIKSDYSVFDEVLWESGPLTERDLNIPKGVNTNVTGSMGFKKGNLKGVDQRHYFRDVIFKTLDWQFDTNVSKRHLERARLNLRIIIEDIDYGIYSIVISHNTNKESRTYKQNNHMTELKWGNARSLIAHEELVGKIAYLHKSKIENDVFTLIIK